MLKIYYIHYTSEEGIQDRFISCKSAKEAVEILARDYKVPKDTIVGVYEYINKTDWL